MSPTNLNADDRLGSYQIGGVTLATPRRQCIAGDLIHTIGGYVSGSNTPNLNQEFAIPFVVPTGLKISELRVVVATAGSAGAILRLGQRDDNNGWPANGVVELGQMDVTTTGVKAITGLSIVSAQSDGLVWISAVQQVATAAYQGYTQGGLHWISDLANTGAAINFSGWPSTSNTTGAFGSFSGRGQTSYQYPIGVYALLATV